nr:pitrilysin family protein [uncultured Desulfuromonas sp.]
MSHEFQRFSLENGVRLLVTECTHLHRVEMVCYVGVGSRYETAAQAGLSHFLEHMMFRGNDRFASGPLIEQAFEAVGSTVNAATDAETTSYYASVHPDHVDEGGQLFADLLQTPLFEGLETERAIVLEEAMSDFNEHGEDICPDNLMGRMMWGEHPLAQPVIGFPQTIRTFQREDLVHWYQRYYTPDNLVICVAGPVDAQQVFKAVAHSWGAWQGQCQGNFERFSAQRVSGASSHSYWVKDSDSQVAIQLAWRTDGRHSSTSLGLRALRQVLGDGGACRLMQSLREDSGLTYSVDASLEEYADCGCFSIDLSTDPDNLVAVVEVLLKEAALVHQPVSEDELQRVVQRVHYRLDFSRDNVEDLASRYGWGELTGCMRTLADEARCWQSVNSASVLDAARTCLCPERMYFVCVGPWRNKDRERVEQLLAACALT